MKRLMRIAAAAVLAALAAFGAGAIAFAEEQPGAAVDAHLDSGGAAQLAGEGATWVVEGFDKDAAVIEAVSVDGKAVQGITNQPPAGGGLPCLETRINEMSEGLWSFGFTYHPEDDQANTGIPPSDCQQTLLMPDNGSAQVGFQLRLGSC